MKPTLYEADMVREELREHDPQWAFTLVLYQGNNAGNLNSKYGGPAKDEIVKDQSVPAHPDETLLRVYRGLNQATVADIRKELMPAADTLVRHTRIPNGVAILDGLAKATSYVINTIDNYILREDALDDGVEMVRQEDSTWLFGMKWTPKGESK